MVPEDELADNPFGFDDDNDDDAEEQAVEEPEDINKDARKDSSFFGEDYDDEHWSRILHTPESVALRIVRSNYFDGSMVGVILANMFFIVEETNQRARHGEAPRWLFGINMAFLVFYCIEIAMRLIIEKKQYFRKTMNVMDFAIVCVDLVANFLESLVGNTPSIAVLRIVRAGRLVKVIQSVEACRELWLMLHGMAAAMKAMSWAMVLMFLTFIIWSVITVEMVRPTAQQLDCEECSDSFDDITTAMFTWFDLIFVGEAWPSVAIPIMEVSTFSIIVFFLAFVSINLCLMNLILTVIVDSATNARSIDQANKSQLKRKESREGKQRLRKICELMDTDGNGHFTLDELKEGWKNNEDFRSTLEVMDVQEGDLEKIFEFMTESEAEQSTKGMTPKSRKREVSTRTIGARKFINSLYKMKNEEAHTMLSFIKFNIEEVHGKMEEQVQGLKRALERQRKKTAKRAEQTI